MTVFIGSAAGAVGGSGGPVFDGENATAGPLEEHPEDPGPQTVGPHEHARFEGNVSTSAVEREMYEEVNAIRTGELSEAELRMYNLTENLKLEAWETDEALASAARAQAAHLAHNEYFAHTTPAGKEFSAWYYEDMNRSCGSCYLMQNIAKTGFFIDGMPYESTARTGDLNETFARLIVSQFMHSGPHKTTLTSPGDATMGFGVHVNRFSLYTTQDVKVQFGDSTGSSPADTDANDAPVAKNWSVSTTTNDPASGTFDVSDPNGDSMTTRIVAGPSHGSVRLNAETGEFVYTPAAGYTGTDSFTYEVRDGNGGTDTGRVIVTVRAADTHESGLSERVFDSITGPDGELSRSDVLSVVQRYVAGERVAGIELSRADVMALMRYYTGS